MPRPRSEYRYLDPAMESVTVVAEPGVRLATEQDRDAFAELLLDAYRGTVDDEGEGIEEARAAADDWLARRVPDWSIIIEEGGRIAALSFVVTVAGRPYIDPVATASAWKRQGYGSRVVLASLRRLRAAGHAEVGAVITDGNAPSERLFAALGFERVGPWGG